VVQSSIRYGSVAEQAETSLRDDLRERGTIFKIRLTTYNVITRDNDPWWEVPADSATCHKLQLSYQSECDTKVKFSETEIN